MRETLKNRAFFQSSSSIFVSFDQNVVNNNLKEVV